MNKIVVIGSINTDMVVRTAHIPAPGETILGSSFFITGGGKGANQAVAVAKQGGHAYMVGKVGSDVFGEQAILNLQYENVDTNFVYTDPQYPSGVALIAVADNGENSIIVASGANGALSKEDVARAKQAIAQCDFIMLQLEIPLDTVVEAINLAKKHNKKVILNPAPAAVLDDKILQQVDIIIPNQSETFLMTGIEVTNLENAEKAAGWFHDKKVNTVIITLAEQGCYVSGPAFKDIVKGHKVDKVIDTVAAGDTFCGALAVALSEGKTLADAARFANIAAALSVTRKGAQASIPLKAETDAIFFLKIFKMNIIKYCWFILLPSFMTIESTAQEKSKPVSIIFDSDIGPDYDDVGAITLLHAFADNGEARILATIASNKYPNAAAVLSVFNTYFKRPDLPIGVPKGEAVNMSDGQHWSDSIVAKYSHKIHSNDDAEEAVRVYRKILSQQPDNSVTIVTVGFVTNLANLMISQPDEYSQLDGMMLIKQKVKRLVSMAGWFPEGKEFNVMEDSAASQIVFNKWPTEAIFSGFEIGEKIKTGLPLVQNNSIQSSPVKDVFSICLPMAQEDKYGRSSWDETATLVAVKGPEPYYRLQHGHIIVNSDGSNNWSNDGAGQYYLVEKLPHEQVQNLINELMQHLPKQ